MSAVWNHLFKCRLPWESDRRGNLWCGRSGTCQRLPDPAEEHDVVFRSGCFFRNTSTVLYSPTHQMSGIYFYLISTITSAQPYNIPVFPLIQFFQYRQMTKSLTFQFKSVCHPLSLTFRQKKRCGRNVSCRTAVRILLFIRFLFSSDKYCCQ